MDSLQPRQVKSNRSLPASLCDLPSIRLQSYFGASHRPCVEMVVQRLHPFDSGGLGARGSDLDDVISNETSSGRSRVTVRTRGNHSHTLFNL
jgi:hypothetical protein